MAPAVEWMGTLKAFVSARAMIDISPVQPLEPVYLLRLYNLIHEESIHQQTKMMNKKTNKLKSSE